VKLLIHTEDIDRLLVLDPLGPLVLVEEFHTPHSRLNRRYSEADTLMSTNTFRNG
jgi:hypothetical protein